MLKLILNHETMLYKDPQTNEYPIKSNSLIYRIFKYGKLRLLEMFFSKEFNLSLRRDITNTSAGNYDYSKTQITIGDGILKLALISQNKCVKCIKVSLSCKDIDLSNQINETLIFELLDSINCSDAINIFKQFKF